jgi:hypothetical protein
MHSLGAAEHPRRPNPIRRQPITASCSITAAAAGCRAAEVHGGGGLWRPRQFVTAPPSLLYARRRASLAARPGSQSEGLAPVEDPAGRQSSWTRHTRIRLPAIEAWPAPHGDAAGAFTRRADTAENTAVAAVRARLGSVQCLALPARPMSRRLGHLNINWISSGRQARRRGGSTSVRQMR